MKRITAGLILLCLSVLPAAAQVTFGVRTGGSFSTLVEKEGTTYKAGGRIGYSVAGLAEIPLRSIHRRLSLRTEAAFVSQGGSFYTGRDAEGEGGYNNKCGYYSLRLPVAVAYTFPFHDVHISVSAGPAVDFALFGNMRNRDKNGSMSFGRSEGKDLKPVDLGVGVGLTVEYLQCFFSVVTNGGVTDRKAFKPAGEPSVYQNNVTFSLGYYFRK
ncbi:hypothetical protein Barb7_01879 [Bacteroidales bacterium Barb7]|nr:hypothetical protein Barb7_01879 [Bacteroidales bacterium Barb7]